MDMCKWFVNHIWNRGLQKVLLLHGARVLAVLTRLVLEIVFMTEAAFARLSEVAGGIRRSVSYRLIEGRQSTRSEKVETAC